MKKITLLFRILIFFILITLNSNFSYAQNRDFKKAETYLSQRGELVFTFTANNFSEIRQLSKIVSFDHGQNPNSPLTIKAIANKKQFNQFLAFKLPYSIDDVLNSPKKVLMSNSNEYKKTVASKADGLRTVFSAPLTFPLTAYPTYQDYADQMALFAANNPTICELVDIGGTTEGDKRLLFIKLSDNVSIREQEPRMMYTSSMHGDEIAGFPMMLDLINYFITAYNDTGHTDHTRVKDLIDNSEIWINPNANPDGTYYNDPSNTSVANARRANDNGWDLNRNYPDNIGGAHPDGNSVYELETQQFMALADTNHFVLSANFHGGTEVVNYPWDNTYTRHADDDWFFLISKEYAVNSQDDALAYDGNTGYMDATYSNYVWPGVTNGADWYRVEGGRQDYMNYYKLSKESTIELSNVKTPPASELDNLWYYNKEALIDYLIQGSYGFRGLVKDALTNNPINAKITLVGHDNTNSHTETELPLGDYYRPTIAGTYDILFEADCYQSYTLTNQSISDYATKILADVLLTPIASSAPSNLAVSNVQSTTATLTWDAVTGATYDYQYREVGSSTWTTGSTSNTSISLINLNISTQYEAQIRSICNSNTSPYSSLVLFTTSNIVTIHEGYFETGLDGWTDGGNDVMRYSGSRSFEGSYSMQLRDNSGVSSAITSQLFNLSSFAQVNVDFHFYANSMENGEDIWLRYNDGSGWTTIATWASGSAFNNNTFNNVSFTLDESQFNLVNNGQFRIQCDASGNNDQVYIDQIIITGIPSGPDVTPPSAPSNLITTNTTQTTTNLSWNTSTDNIGVTGYDVYQDNVFLVTVLGTSHQVTELSASTAYTFYVKARDEAGNTSENSNTVNVTTQNPPDTEAPTAPSNLIASNITHDSTDLSWTASTDNVGVTGYDVYQNGSFVTNVLGTSYQVLGLTPSTLYSFYIIARDAAGNSSTSSNNLSVTTDDFIDTEAPSTPTGLVASNTTETTTNLIWNASTDNVGVTGYDIYQDGGFIINTVGTSYQVTDLLENTVYSFYIIARDAAGLSSGQSNTVNITTLAAPTCDDGIQNGDETGIDCGGSFCPTCPPTDTILQEGYFETGLDGWTLGGKDASRNSTSFSYEGAYSIKLRDNSGTSSSMSSPILDLSPYNQIEVDFHFYANSMENGEDVWLRYNDGSGWVTVATWISGSSFNNNAFNNVNFILDNGSYNLVNGGQFRIQCDASAKNDQVYIDQVVITGIASAASRFATSKTNTPNSLKSTLLIYPNPTKGDILNVRISGINKFTYKVLNTIGQIVIQGNSNGEVNVNKLESGIYLIEVNNGIEIMTKRFIRE